MISAGALALLLHEVVVARHVYAETFLPRHQLRQVDGEAVGVVEEEGHLARHVAARGGLDELFEQVGASFGPEIGFLQQVDGAGIILKAGEHRLRMPVGFGGEFLEIRRDALEEGNAFAERVEKALLLRPDVAFDALAVALQLGKWPAHQRLQRLDELIQKRLAEAECLIAVAHRAPQNPPNHIPPPDVARHGTVGNGKGDGADMISHYAHGDAKLLPLTPGVDVVVTFDGFER